MLRKSLTKKSASKKTGKAFRTKTPKPIGMVTHFFGGIKVAIVKFKKPVRMGAELHFKGATTDFTSSIASMQYDHKPIHMAPKGKEVGIKVAKKVRVGDKVYEAE